jgi:hypothetical protein
MTDGSPEPTLMRHATPHRDTLERLGQIVRRARNR